MKYLNYFYSILNIFKANIVSIFIKHLKPAEKLQKINKYVI